MLVTTVGFDAARCAANAAMRDPVFEPMLAAAVADPYSIPDLSTLATERTRVEALGAACAWGTIGVTR